MYRWIKILAILFALPAVAPAGEPDYQDKPLSEWVKQLKSPDAFVRQNAVFAIGQMNFRAREAVPDLIGCLSDPALSVRAEAADSLGRIGSGASAAVPRILEIVASKQDVSVRAAAVLALGYIGQSRESLPALITALKDPEPLVRVHASQALGRLGRGASEARSALVEAQNDPHLDVRRNAREALKRLDSPRRRR